MIDETSKKPDLVGRGECLVAAALLASLLTLVCSAEQGIRSAQRPRVPAACAVPPTAPAPGAGLLAQESAVQSIVTGLRLSWPGKPGFEYVVWYSEDIGNPEWVEVGRVFCRYFQELSFFENARPDRQGFYRIEKARPMVLVPGSDGGGVGYDFYMGKYEVTNAEFALFLSADPSHESYWYQPYIHEEPYMQIVRLKRNPKLEPLPTFVPTPGWEDHPVTHVSWQAAAAYCNWLSEKDGLEKVYDEVAGWIPDMTKSGYRLPTAEEWYKAAGWDPTKDGVGGFWKYGCRSDGIRKTLANHRTGGDPYGGGGWEGGPQPGFEPPPRDPETTPVGYYNGSSYLLYDDGERSYRFTTEDGRSCYGCYDMSGNVSELISLRSGDAWTPARMGDHWWNPLPADWDLSNSGEHIPSQPSSGIGFRLARTAP